MKRYIIFSVWLIVCVSMSSVASADFVLGDVFAGVNATGTINQYDGSAIYKTTLSNGAGGFMTGMGFDSAGNLYGTDFSNDTITQYTGPTSPHVVTSGYANTDSSSSVESIVFDAAGNFYVGQAHGTKDILKFSADGTTILGRYDVATEVIGSDWIDLAADQKTMYYTSEGRNIYRYDVSTDTQLADFATLAGTGTAFALRLLADGGLLVADRSEIKRLDNTGAQIQTYDVAGINFWFALNLDPDGTSFWSADVSTGNFYKFDIANGNVLASGTANQAIYGLAVYGEITQGNPQVPVPGAVLLGLLGLSTAGMKLRRRRS